MTITQANAVNSLLVWLLDARHDGRPINEVNWDAARDAAAFLADHASKALSAGLDGRAVAELWEQQNAAGALRRKRSQIKAARAKGAKAP